MKKKIISTAVVVLASVGVGSYLLSTPSKNESKGPESFQETPANSSSAVAPVTSEVAQKPEMVTPPATAPAKESISGHDVRKEFKHRAELDRYLTLQKKVLMNTAEEEIRKSLLQDRDFIQSLKPLLVVEASKENTSLQNAALDYLFEALQNGARDEAAAVLKAVVADSTIESDSHSMETRRALAGVKAEVLLNWSSLDPSAEAHIEGSLPGPVSQKIWSRVKAHQDNNAAESATLQASK